MFVDRIHRVSVFSNHGWTIGECFEYETDFLIKEMASHNHRWTFISFLKNSDTIYGTNTPMARFWRRTGADSLY